MCGRFSLTHKIEEVIEAFNIINSVELAPSYNIAPSQNIAVIRNVNDQLELSAMRWGLIPSWMKELPKSLNLINARAESVAEKPSFRSAYKKRRCLIPADGFYEWQKLESGKQPRYIQLKDKSVFTFAGLWEHWEQEGQSINSCTIITTQANKDMKSIHHRMPVIINKTQHEAWFNQVDASPLFAPYPNDSLNIYPVSTFVNNPTHNTETCIQELT